MIRLNIVYVRQCKQTMCIHTSYIRPSIAYYIFADENRLLVGLVSTDMVIICCFVTLTALQIREHREIAQRYSHIFLLFVIASHQT